jgi:hypothetical protein
MAETMNLDWNTLDPNLLNENLGESDIAEAESMGRPEVGKYICTCVGSVPRQKDFKEYSCIAANLKWRIDQPVELRGVPVKADEGDTFIGRFIFDEVALPAPQEKQGMKNRRVMIAKRTGLISETGGALTAQHWATGIIGKRALINFIEEEYAEKKKDPMTGQFIETGAMKKSRKVAFDGYDYADKALVSGGGAAQTTVNVDDI